MRGTVVCGKYRLNLPLGSGGMAEVWSATNTFTDRQVAIKFLNRALEHTPEAATRLLREAKVSARVDHPNVIQMLDVGSTEDGQLFLVMELLTGMPLEVALLRQTPALSLRDFSRIMLDVARALAAAHRAGVVHRDLKPTNIFLHQSRPGVVVPKLLDFGVSKFEDALDPKLTAPGTVLGSPLYMSPEQARGEVNIDGRTDVFSFGALLFESLSGQRPFEARNFNALIVKIATTTPRSIDHVAPSLPRGLRRVIRTCMEPNPAHRAGSFEVVIPLLEQAIAELDALEDQTRLPRPLNMPANVDPDATNALPVLRSEPSLSYTATPMPIPPPRRAPSFMTLVTGFAALGILVGAVAPRLAQLAPDLPEATAKATALVATASAAEPTSTPVLSLPDATPVAALPDARPAPARPRVSRGFLDVVSPAGGCTVSIDGKERAATPYHVELSAGVHAVACQHEGRRQAQHVTIREGATSTVVVELPDEP